MVLFIVGYPKENRAICKRSIGEHYMSVEIAILLTSLTSVVGVIWFTRRFPPMDTTARWAHGIAICVLASVPLGIFILLMKYDVLITESIPALAIGTMISLAELLVAYIFIVLICAFLAVVSWVTTNKIARWISGEHFHN